MTDFSVTTSQELEDALDYFAANPTDTGGIYMQTDITVSTWTGEKTITADITFSGLGHILTFPNNAHIAVRGRTGGTTLAVEAIQIDRQADIAAALTEQHGILVESDDGPVTITVNGCESIGALATNNPVPGGTGTSAWRLHSTSYDIVGTYINSTATQWTNDGFSGDTEEGTTVTMHLVNCESVDNWDEGATAHENTTITITGGTYDRLENIATQDGAVATTTATGATILMPAANLRSAKQSCLQVQAQSLIELIDCDVEMEDTCAANLITMSGGTLILKGCTLTQGDDTVGPITGTGTGNLEVWDSTFVQENTTSSALTIFQPSGTWCATSFFRRCTFDLRNWNPNNTAVAFSVAAATGPKHAEFEGCEFWFPLNEASTVNMFRLSNINILGDAVRIVGCTFFGSASDVDTGSHRCITYQNGCGATSVIADNLIYDCDFWIVQTAAHEYATNANAGNNYGFTVGTWISGGTDTTAQPGDSPTASTPGFVSAVTPDLQRTTGDGLTSSTVAAYKKWQSVGSYGSYQRYQSSYDSNEKVPAGSSVGAYTGEQRPSPLGRGRGRGRGRGKGWDFD